MGENTFVQRLLETFYKGNICVPQIELALRKENNTITLLYFPLTKIFFSYSENENKNKGT